MVVVVVVVALVFVVVVVVILTFVGIAPLAPLHGINHVSYLENARAVIVGGLQHRDQALFQPQTVRNHQIGLPDGHPVPGGSLIVMWIGAYRQQHRNRGVISNDPLHQIPQDGGGRHHQEFFGRFGVYGGFGISLRGGGSCLLGLDFAVVGAVATRPEHQQRRHRRSPYLESPRSTHFLSPPGRCN